MVRSSNGKDTSLSRKKQKFNSSANHHYLCEYLLSCDLDKSHFIKFCDIFNIANLASSFNGQDISLSRQRQGFNSPRSRHSPYGLKDRTNQASEATVMLKPIRLLIKANPPLCRKTNIFVELIFRQIICRLSLQVKQLHTIERYQPSLVDMLLWRNRQTQWTLMYFTHNLMSAVIFHRECLKGNLQSRS